MTRLFGTDGVRGLANGTLTAELALSLSEAAARVLATTSSRRPLAVVGRDPRPSGEFLEAAVVAGLAGAGVDVVRVGILPTPAVALLTAHHEADLGVMLSASHNAMPDNGIKFFGAGGHKLDDAVEDEIAAAVGQPWKRPTGADVGRVTDSAAAAQVYAEHVLASLPHRLDGLKVVVDCANGAAAAVAPGVLRAAGAEVIVLHDALDGVAINEACGSTHPESLQAAVVAHGADAGIAHDGDADRCLAVDASGDLVDGDQIMGILAVALDERGALAGRTLVATVMSNLGLKIAMREAGIVLVETAVGDRYVLEAMRSDGFTLGGEQSGHVLMLDHATTGDGLLTGAHLLARMAQTGRPLAELAAVVQRLPQVLINVSGVDRAALGSNPQVAAAVADAEAELAENGRVLLRPSGTEPLVRVMVEAGTPDQAQDVAERLASVVRASLAL
jgi:phosphoglucosamine mutase